MSLFANTFAYPEYFKSGITNSANFSENSALQAAFTCLQPPVAQKRTKDTFGLTTPMGRLSAYQNPPAELFQDNTASKDRAQNLDVFQLRFGLKQCREMPPEQLLLPGTYPLTSHIDREISNIASLLGERINAHEQDMPIFISKDEVSRTIGISTWLLQQAFLLLRQLNPDKIKLKRIPQIGIQIDQQIAFPQKSIRITCEQLCPKDQLPLRLKTDEAIANFLGKCINAQSFPFYMPESEDLKQYLHIRNLSAAYKILLELNPGKSALERRDYGYRINNSVNYPNADKRLSIEELIPEGTPKLTTRRIQRSPRYVATVLGEYINAQKPPFYLPPQMEIAEALGISECEVKRAFDILKTYNPIKFKAITIYHVFIQGPLKYPSPIKQLSAEEFCSSEFHDKRGTEHITKALIKSIENNRHLLRFWIPSQRAIADTWGITQKRVRQAFETVPVFLTEDLVLITEHGLGTRVSVVHQLNTDELLGGPDKQSLFSDDALDNVLPSPIHETNKSYIKLAYAFIEQINKQIENMPFQLPTIEEMSEQLGIPKNTARKAIHTVTSINSENIWEKENRIVIIKPLKQISESLLTSEKPVQTINSLSCDALFPDGESTFTQNTLLPAPVRQLASDTGILAIELAYVITQHINAHQQAMPFKIPTREESMEHLGISRHLYQDALDIIESDNPGKISRKQGMNTIIYAPLTSRIELIQETESKLLASFNESLSVAKSNGIKLSVARFKLADIADKLGVDYDAIILPALYNLQQKMPGSIMLATTRRKMNHKLMEPLVEVRFPLTPQ